MEKYHRLILVLFFFSTISLLPTIGCLSKQAADSRPISKKVDEATGLPTKTPELTASFPQVLNKIAFLSDRDHPKSSDSWRQRDRELYIIEVDGTQERRVTYNLGVNWYVSWLDWKPKTPQILVESFGSWIMVNIQDNSFTEMEGPRVPTGKDQPIQRSWPTWSPTGEWLVYTSFGGLLANISISKADGMKVKQITPDYLGAILYRPSWSPDSQNILFNHYNPSVNPEIKTAFIRPPTGVYIVPVDGTDATRIIVSNTIRELSWSPDGTKISFENSRKSDIFAHDIWVADSNGANGINLTNLQGNDTAWSPRWSPDGTKIAFTLEKPGSSQVYIINADGTNLTQLTSQGNNCCPTWSR